MPKFRTLTLHEKIIAAGSVLASIITIVAFLGLNLPRPVWAGEFYAFQKNVVEEQLNRAKKELRSIKREEYMIQRENKEVPVFIIEEKLELEDKVEELEKQIDKINEEIGG